MKLKITLGLWLGLSGVCHAQLATPGDLAFVGFNADGNDDLAFVTFKDITPDTNIYFCDSEWNGTAFGTDEGDFTWNSGDQIIPAGTVVMLNNVSTGMIPSVGSIVLNNAGGLSNDDEAMFAFLGTAPRVPTTMLAAIANNATAFGSLDGTGLTAGTTAIVLPQGTDIGNYNGPRTGLTHAAYLAQLNDAAQWQVENASGNDATNGITPDLPFNGTPFAIALPTLAFAAEHTFVNENAGTISASIALSSPSMGEVTVELSVLEGIGNALAGTDFTFTPQTVTFPALSTEPIAVDIVLTDNDSGNIDKFFVLSLTDANGATIAGATQTVYVLDDENHAPTATNALDINFLTSYLVDGEGTAEIVDFDPVSKRLFVLNSTATKVHILDFSNPLAITPVQTIDMAAYGIGATSVAFKNGIVAATVESADFANGKVVLMDIDGGNISVVEAGVLPDMVTFTPDGTKVLTANEGQPNSDYTIDPEGSVSIIDVSGGLGNIHQSNVTTVNFNAFDSQIDNLRAQGIRIFGPNATVSKDFEPEYITLSEDGQTAWVTLQENNAIARIDLATQTVTDVFPLGTKDFSLAQNSVDFSDQTPEILMSTWPVKGLYMPDAMANYTANGVTYLVTANEGDAREYDALEEETKVGSGGYVLDPVVFPNAALLKKNFNLGRLAVTSQSGDTDGDGDFDEIHAFGSRSFSIWNAQTGALVFDSGDDFERITATDPVYGALFNASNDNSGFKNRSDNKGPEPEGITVAAINGATYAFITLERIGGLMVYDITDPANARFVAYKNNRTPGTTQGDLGPEGIIYISPEHSPTQKGLIVMANEVSATISAYQIENDVLGVREMVAGTNLLVYPNPVKNGKLFLSKPANAKWFDLSGRLVGQKDNASVLDVSHLAKGIYILQANAESFKIVVE
ncbi:choice-of-anchor I family protein [Flavobacterium caeni]|uniref:Por secretion system C-terminal sorting domain-containing protein n=1 Tax=Flavobacterium caeni TaxID=490189 RepID=A0A1G5IPI7_9FLAO|nr:choice-of-anchor I family protein [Flavobacterium caeni]SCY77499.1 Por secretion system C-terminal sorting domain-containing protein [Flavobacterium caeni]